MAAEAPGAPAYGRPYAAYGEPSWRTEPSWRRPYPVYGEPYGRGPYPAYSAMPPDDNEHEGVPPNAAPPRNVAPNPIPSPARVSPRGERPVVSPDRSATLTPAAPVKPPMPRKRPDMHETAKKTEPGTIAPVPAAPASPVPQGAPAAAPATPAMPPINPLE